MKRSGRFLNETGVLTVKLNKLTVKVDRPKLSEEDIKKLEGAEAEALEGQPLKQAQPGPQ